jgi:hypothetical protein
MPRDQVRRTSAPGGLANAVHKGCPGVRANGQPGTQLLAAVPREDLNTLVKADGLGLAALQPPFQPRWAMPWTIHRGTSTLPAAELEADHAGPEGGDALCGPERRSHTRGRRSRAPYLAVT